MYKILAAAFALCLSTGVASAVTLSVVSADCDTDFVNTTGLGVTSFTCPTKVGRDNSANVNYGTGDGSFYSLGLGGGIVFEIDPGFTGPATIVEVTGRTNHREAVDVYGSSNGTLFSFLGTVTNRLIGTTQAEGQSVSLSFTGTYNFLGLMDVTKREFASSGSDDGFDLDSISVTPAPAPVPLPAAAFLLLGGVGALGLLRRRRNVAA